MPGTADTRLLLFGGKGGVGKTTCAAAAALALSARFPDRRVLLLSTDPAHSLADALGAAVSATAATIHGGPANLTVRELDSAQAFREARLRHAGAIDAWFDRLSRHEAGSVGIDAAYDRRVMHGLMDLAPPGIDELTAVMEVTETLDDPAGGADVIVMDTAPSGHALRLLEMPALVQDWSRAFMSILLKYQPVAGVGELGPALLRISQGLGRLRALLTDPARTSFIAVTRAASLPGEETRRLLQRLSAMNVDVPFILVNAVGRGTCTRCRAASIEQARELLRIERVSVRPAGRPLPIVVAPAELPPPHGVPALRRWHSSWRARRAAGSIGR
jgi:arsenite-transporting ATPase